MSEITSELVSAIARVWHRFRLSEPESRSLAEMLRPMDDAGEAASESLAFDAVPADYELALEALAEPEDGA